MSFQSIPFDSLSYLHPTQHPAPTIQGDGDKCVLKTVPGTDWWHTLDRDSQDGIAWGIWKDIGEGGGFEVRVKASIKEVERVSCLFFYLGPHAWIKAGVEFDMGKKWDGAVVCNPFSDWAITPAKEGVTYTISYDPKTKHIRIFIDEVMIREVHGFPTPQSSSGSGVEKDGKVFVGIMGCSPLGKGTEATFGDLEWRDGVRDLV